MEPVHLCPYCGEDTSDKGVGTVNVAGSMIMIATALHEDYDDELRNPLTNWCNLGCFLRWIGTKR